jgi:hypothetical protein
MCNLTIKVRSCGKEIKNITRLCEFLGFEYVGEFYSPGGICESLEYEGKVVRNGQHYYVARPTKGWTELRELNWAICQESWIEENSATAYISFKSENQKFYFKTVENLMAFLKINKGILDDIYVHYEQKTMLAEDFKKWFKS